jgi:hypothetical protein
MGVRRYNWQPAPARAERASARRRQCGASQAGEGRRRAFEGKNA